jgi:dTDP-4-amino-4,6-dideoxygalactose transaminase
MKKTIPFFSLSRQCSNLKKTLEPKLKRLYDRNKFVGGPYVSDFENAFARYIDSFHAISCNSGTDALWLALKAVDIRSQSIVITTPFSFIASSSEIVAHNAYPIFIDVDGSYNISPKKIESWLKINGTIRNNQTFHKKTNLPIEGIVTVDLFGQCSDYKQIKSIAKEWNLWIIEDACQAIGAHINGKKAGTFGDISCFSLYPTKNLGVYGDGGVITTNNPIFAEKLLKLRNHGRTSNYEYEFLGINSRLDAIQALIAAEKLQLLDKSIDRRRAIAHTYSKRFLQLPHIKVPTENVGHHVYNQYCVEVTGDIVNRDFLRKHLEEHGVGTNIFYPKALNEIPFLQPPSELATKTPVAKKLTNTILALPIWPELTDKEVIYICDCVEEGLTLPLTERSVRNLGKTPLRSDIA